MKRIKNAVRDIVCRLRIRDIAPSANPEKGFPTVVGMFGTPIGIGETARLCLAALRDLGIRAGYIDISHLFRAKDKNIIPLPSDELASIHNLGPLILHINPPELNRTLAYLGKDKTHGRLLVGCWVWELPNMPATWRGALKQIHEIWVPSRFCAEALRRETDKPVHIVPYPVRPFSGLPWDRRLLQIEEHSFVALCGYDMRSSQSRKNPIGAIRAFRQAFGDSQAAHLLVKVTDPERHCKAFDQLQREIQNAKNIHLLTKSLSSEQMQALIAGVDAVISLHRSEGFGLLAAQAMLAGKAVIATAWSGNMDFMDAESAALVPYRIIPVEDPQGVYRESGQKWADPEIDVASEFLYRLANDLAYRDNLGRNASRKAKTSLGLDAYAASLSESFRSLTCGDMKAF